MYKLFVSDFDGTLINSEEAIPLSTMVEIDRIRKLGVKFCIATGRILKSILDYNRDFPFLDYIIACDGAYVYDVVHHKVLSKKALGGSIIKKIKKLYHDKYIYFCTVQELNLCSKNTVYCEQNDKNITFDEFYQKNKNDIYKIEVHFKTQKERDSAYDEIHELGINANVVKMKEGKKDFLLEIVASDVNKAKGLERVCKAIHISLDEVVCVGDNEDDLPIFLSTGFSAAVANGSKKLKQVASIQTSSNETKGVEKVMKKLF